MGYLNYKLKPLIWSYKDDTIIDMSSNNQKISKFLKEFIITRTQYNKVLIISIYLFLIFVFIILYALFSFIP